VNLFAGTLDPAGPAARDIDDLWMLMLAVGTAVFVLVIVLLIMGLRRSSGGPETPEPVEQRGAWLVGGGVVLPAVGVLVVLVATLAVMRGTADADDAEMSIEVIGNQFWWEFQYPDRGVETAGELHIPAGVPVALRITSTDVIHSFWVPALAGKMDAIPEDVNVLVIEADEPGRYRGRCAEFCGLNHAFMDLEVVAHSPAAFAAWLDGQAAPAAEPTGAEARRGAELFRAEGCGQCHRVRGTGADGERGPDLTHVASREVLAGGRVQGTADDMGAWIHDPDEFKEGVDMPASTLSDEDVQAIVSYLQALE
jgi:cytochrome c oxidase subunit 2